MSAVSGDGSPADRPRGRVFHVRIGRTRAKRHGDLLTRERAPGPSAPDQRFMPGMILAKSPIIRCIDSNAVPPEVHRFCMAARRFCV